MAQEHYEGPANILMNGSLLAQAVSVSISGASNSTAVKTMKLGVAGRSKGAFSTQVQVSSAVPIAGLEQAYDEMCVEDADVSIEYVAGGKKKVIDGWIDSFDQSNDAEAASKFDFVVMGGKPRFL